MPDSEDYAELSTLLARPEQWTAREAVTVRTLRRQQVEAAAAYDHRDTRRVASMTNLVAQLDEAIAIYDRSRAP